MERHAPLRLLLVGAALVAATTATPVRGAIDAHYQGLLRQGSYAFERGDAATAAKLLRLACFGMLDEPPALADCLVRLGLAQSRTQDGEGFAETFRRLSELESRAKAYSAGPVADELKEGFEEAAARLVARSALTETSAFRHLAVRSEELAIRRLPTSRRREEIDRRIAAEPANGRWKLLAAETAIEEARWGEAADWAEKALAAVKGRGEISDGHCLRGFALSRQQRCSEAVTDLAACGDVRTTLEPARAMLSCWIELGRFAEAAELLAALPTPIREDRQIDALRRRIPVAPATSATKPVTEAPAEATPKPAPPLPPPTVAPLSEPPPDSSVVEPELTRAEDAKLQQARKLLAEARRRADLEEPMRLAQEVADARPTHREAQFLAAAIAYRASRWPAAVRYFRQGGDPESAELLFYFAVALYEIGDLPGAAAMLRRSLPGLERTPFVEGYREKILAGAGEPGGD